MAWLFLINEKKMGNLESKYKKYSTEELKRIQKSLEGQINELDLRIIAYMSNPEKKNQYIHDKQEAVNHLNVVDKILAKRHR